MLFTQSCRLLRDEPAVGSRNMAIDEALLESSSLSGIATLRFYRWSRPTLSLGYFQRLADRAQHAESAACDIVRRSTGGGAIVHDDELTYSLAIQHRGSGKSQSESLYFQVHGALVSALMEFGVHATTACDAGGAQVGEAAFLCFQRRAACDVLVGGQKIAGSAQRRRGLVVLQHGSVLLGQSSAAPQLHGIAQITGERLDVGELSQVWTRNIEAALGCEFVRGGRTEQEEARAEVIERVRYLNPAWTGRR